MKRAIVVIAVAALLLTVGAFALPRHAAAQVFGGYVDSMVFSVLPQDQSIAALSAGDIDMYIFSLDAATDKVAARDDPNINVKQAFSGFRGMQVNPVAPSSGDFNPFTIREIREAMHWAYDRDFIATEIEGGFAIPMYSAHFQAEPEFVRDAAFFAGIETSYSYDPARAKAIVDDAMSRVSGATFNSATNQWLMNGANIEVIIVQRVEDTRFEIGAYVATEVTKLGFTSVLDPSTFSEALDKVYFNDAKLGQWNMYTEGWGSSGFVQFEDTQTNYFYNGDFGSALWDDYTPPASLSIACETLNDGLYTTLDERRDLQRACTSLGMKDGIRSFVTAQTDVYAYNDVLSNTAFGIFAGNLQPFALRTTMKNGVAGGTLNIAQPVHTGSGWNAYGGHQDVYSVYAQVTIQDFGTYSHPHTGLTIPVRTPFTINNVGPLGTHDVPTSAQAFNVSSNLFENVTAGLTTGAYVDFDMLFGEFHHGEAITMTDVVAQIAMMSRMASGDLAIQNPNNAAQIYLTRWDSSFKGFEVLDADTIRMYYDTYNPDETLIAGRIPIFPWYPWELNQIMTESVLSNAEVAFDDTSAGLLNQVELDLAKGATLTFFDPRLADNLANSMIPAFLLAGNLDPALAAQVAVDTAAADARWTALDEWRNRVNPACVNGPSIWTCNYYVSQGPYYLDQYFTAPEGALYTAHRTGYPIEQDAWDFLGTIRVPDVVLGTPPAVIQTFPATFEFATSLEGVPYDRIATSAWLLLDPTTKNILFSGDAVRTGPGQWDITLTADQTTALVAGTYDLQTIVVGEEAALPVVNVQSFTSLSLSSAIIADLTVVIDDALNAFQTELDVAVEAADAANAAAAAATSLANTVLIVAIVAVVVAVVAIAFAVVWGRKGGT